MEHTLLHHQRLGRQALATEPGISARAGVEGTHRTERIIVARRTIDLERSGLVGKDHRSAGVANEASRHHLGDNTDKESQD